jgi:hypothetical protein
LKIQDITTDEFIRQYALLITEKDILQFGLLLAVGDSIDQASHHISKGRTNVAIMELKRLGFIIEKHGTG